MAVVGKNNGNNISITHSIFEGCAFNLMDESQKKCYNYINDCFAGKGGCFGGGGSGVSDEEFDRIILGKIESMELNERSKQVINIDSDQIKEIDSLHIAGYAGYEDDKDYKYIFLGKDRKVRNRFYDTTYIHFGEYQLYIYYCRIDSLTDNREETTNEFFYKDITNIEKIVRLRQWSKEMKSGCLGGTTDVKQIAVYRGFTIFVPNSGYSKYTIFQPGIDESIDGMIAKIRDKKNR